MVTDSWLPSMVTYSQNREDVLLRRALFEKKNGFYIDVGASYPSLCSVTRHFYDHGWRGINIEPDVQHEELQRERPRDINLQVGVADKPGALKFYAYGNGLSTFKAPDADAPVDPDDNITSREIPVRTLADICEEHVRGEIDFMSIDVEGLERQVILGGDWKTFRPRIVVIEATLPNSRIPSHDEWEPLLLNERYHFACFDGLNRYYVRDEDRSLLERFDLAVNLFDNAVPHEQILAIAARDSAIAELNAVIADRDLIIAQRNQRDAMIAERDVMIAQRDTIIARRDAQLQPYLGLGPRAVAVARASQRIWAAAEFARRPVRRVRSLLKRDIRTPKDVNGLRNDRVRAA